MTLVVNGEERRFDGPLSLEKLLEELGLATGACATELNRQLVSKKARGDKILNDGDVIEIVTMVGGG